MYVIERQLVNRRIIPRFQSAPQDFLSLLFKIQLYSDSGCASSFSSLCVLAASERNGLAVALDFGPDFLVVPRVATDNLVGHWVKGSYCIALGTYL